MNDQLVARITTLVESLRDRMENVERVTFGGNPAFGMVRIPDAPDELVADARSLSHELRSSAIQAPLLSAWAADPGEDVTSELLVELQNIARRMKKS